MAVLEPMRQHDLHRARAQLGDAKVDALWAEQRAIPIDQVLDEALRDDLLEQPPQPDAARAMHSGLLSARELDVLRLLVEGQTNQEIAVALSISPRTVINHVANMMNKLGLESRTAVAAWAIRQGLV
jgi:DNA-binding NarL/FixJ family response regulator